MRAWWLLVLSTLAYAINVVDRQLLPLLAESIRKDIALADWQFGLLTGITFAAFYALVTMPLAWRADAGNRRNIVAVCLGVFSLATAACGAVFSFWQLALARASVAVGEAGTTPASLSMLSDAYPDRRGFASGVFTAGAHLGVLIGTILAAYLAARFGWRASFYAAGIFGVAVAVLYRLLVREPKRLTARPAERESYGTVLKGLWSGAHFPWLVLATAGLLFFSNATSAWLPTLLIRAHRLTVTQVGLFIGLTAGFAGMVFVTASGPLLDRLMRRDRRWVTWLPSLVFAVILVSTWAGVMARSTPVALILLAVGPSMQLVIQTAIFTMLQTYLPGHRQASAIAMLFLVANLFGMGIGPTLVGALSSYWDGPGQLGLRPALIVGLAPTLLGLVACLRLTGRVAIVRTSVTHN